MQLIFVCAKRVRADCLGCNVRSYRSQSNAQRWCVLPLSVSLYYKFQWMFRIARPIIVGVNIAIVLWMNGTELKTTPSASSMPIYPVPRLLLQISPLSWAQVGGPESTSPCTVLPTSSLRRWTPDLVSLPLFWTPEARTSNIIRILFQVNSLNSPIFATHKINSTSAALVKISTL